jgi:hypothetical protein
VSASMRARASWPRVSDGVASTRAGERGIDTGQSSHIQAATAWHTLEPEPDDDDDDDDADDADDDDDDDEDDDDDDDDDEEDDDEASAERRRLLVRVSPGLSHSPSVVWAASNALNAGSRDSCPSAPCPVDSLVLTCSKSFPHEHLLKFTRTAARPPPW